MMDYSSVPLPSSEVSQRYINHDRCMCGTALTAYD
jgi:hypothetical protein